MAGGDGSKECAVLCILQAGDQMLLLRRNKPGPLHGMYVPIGGHIEPHESPRQAAIREAREEAGIALSEVTFHGVLVETSPVAYNWITFIYSADVGRAFQPPACREGELIWIARGKLPGLPTPDTDAHIYRYVAQGQRFVLDALYDERVRLLSLVEELTGEILTGRAAAPPQPGRESPCRAD